jgi:hypothetical protein
MIIKHKRIKKNRIVKEVEAHLNAFFPGVNLDVEYTDNKKLETKKVVLLIDQAFFVSFVWNYELEESLTDQGIIAEAEIINLIKDSFYDDLLVKYPPIQTP